MNVPGELAIRLFDVEFTTGQRAGLEHDRRLFARDAAITVIERLGYATIDDVVKFALHVFNDHFRHGTHAAGVVVTAVITIFCRVIVTVAGNVHSIRVRSICFAIMDQRGRLGQQQRETAVRAKIDVAFTTFNVQPPDWLFVAAVLTPDAGLEAIAHPVTQLQWIVFKLLHFSQVNCFSGDLPFG